MSILYVRSHEAHERSGARRPARRAPRRPPPAVCVPVAPKGCYGTVT